MNPTEFEQKALAAGFGIDIHQRGFWEDRLGVIAGRVERYCTM